MRHSLRLMVVGGTAALTLAGCHGVKLQLADPSSSAGAGGSARAVTAPGPVSGGSGALRVLAEPQAGVSPIYRLIDGARSSVDLTMYELKDQTAENDLAAAARRGVDVKITMTADSEWDSAFRELARAGAHVRTYSDSSSVLYIHAKAVVADAGLAGEQMFAGSENFSAASLERNRELGIRTTGKPLVSAVAAVLADDYAGAKPY